MTNQNRYLNETQEPVFYIENGETKSYLDLKLTGQFNPVAKDLNLNGLETTTLKEIEPDTDQILYKILDISEQEPFKLENDLLSLSENGKYTIELKNFNLLTPRLKEFYYGVFKDIFRYNKIRNLSRLNFISSQKNLKHLIGMTEQNPKMKEENKEQRLKELKSRFNSRIKTHKQAIRYLSQRVFKVGIIF